MKKRTMIPTLSIGACILFLGILCLAVQTAKNPKWDASVFDHQYTDAEKENMIHEWVGKHITAVLENVDIIQGCDVDINGSAGEITGANIKITLAADSTGEDALKADIAECVSKMLDISAENIVISFVKEGLS